MINVVQGSDAVFNDIMERYDINQIMDMGSFEIIEVSHKDEGRKILIKSVVATESAIINI